MANIPASIETLLGVPQQIGMIQTVKSGIPRVLPEALYNLTRDVMSDFASYKQVTGTRRLPKAAQYGGPSRAAAKQSITDVPVKLVHTIENQQFGQIILQLLSGFSAMGQSIVPQKMAQDEIVRQTVEFKRRFENMRTAAVHSALANGKIWLAADGTFLYNSTGAAVTIDFKIPVASAQTGNVGTMAAILNSDFTGWQTATTDIISQIIALKTRSIQQTGFPLKYAFYGANIMKYLMSNTIASNLITRNPAWNSQFLSSGDIPGGFQDLQWMPVYSAFAEDDNGNIQTFFGPDTIVFTPEITDEWYELLQGSYVIIPSPDVFSGTVGQVMQQAIMPYGQFAYATRTNDPVGVKQVAGDTFLPVIKNPNVVYITTVNF
jgi:hypothetical protein